MSEDNKIAEATQTIAEAVAVTDSAVKDSQDTVKDTATQASKPAKKFDAKHPIQTVGRRKEAIARVKLVPGSGKFKLNGKDLATYFPNGVHQQIIKSPLVLVEKENSFDFQANLNGGGPSGQAGALRLAIARALILVEPEDRAALKKAGFLTRDARMVERKKYGLKKARKASQFSKR